MAIGGTNCGAVCLRQLEAQHAISQLRVDLRLKVQRFQALSTLPSPQRGDATPRTAARLPVGRLIPPVVALLHPGGIHDAIATEWPERAAAGLASAGAAVVDAVTAELEAGGGEAKRTFEAMMSMQKARRLGIGRIAAAILSAVQSVDVAAYKMPIPSSFLSFPRVGPALRTLDMRLPSMVTTENPSGHGGARVLAAPMQVAAQTAMESRR